MKEQDISGSEESELYDEDNESEDNDEQLHDIDQIHIMYQTMLKSLFQQKALASKNIESDEGTINDILHKNRFQRWTFAVSNFLNCIGALRLIDFQISDTYKQYLIQLQTAMQEMEDSGEVLNGLHQMIAVLERQNEKCETQYKFVQQKFENSNSHLTGLQLAMDDLNYDNDKLRLRLKQIEDESHGGRRCDECGGTLLGRAPNALLCELCAEKRSGHKRNKTSTHYYHNHKNSPKKSKKEGPKSKTQPKDKEKPKNIASSQ